MGKTACGARLFYYHSWPGSIWYKHLGVVLNIPHSAIAREGRLDLEQCMATSKAVVATKTVQTSLFAFDRIGWLIMAAIVSHWFSKELFCTSHRTLLLSQLSLLNCWKADSFEKKLIDCCSTMSMTSALDCEVWPEVNARMERWGCSFSSSNPSILLYYQTTIVIVCSFIHYLAKKRIINAISWKIGINFLWVDKWKE